MLGRFRHALERGFFAHEWLPILTRTTRRDAIALTFDDGPSPITTPPLLDLLRQEGATATFFLCGHRVERYPALVEAIVASGHAIYAHGYDHVRMDALSPDAFSANLDRTEALLSAFWPTPSPYIVRLPYGSGHHSLRVHRLLRMWRPDCVLAHWGYSLEDFLLADDCETIEELRRRCITTAERAFSHPRFMGSIVLMHEDPLDIAAPFSPRVAPILLGEILMRARQRGWPAIGLNAPGPRKTPVATHHVAIG